MAAVRPLASRDTGSASSFAKGSATPDNRPVKNPPPMSNGMHQRTARLARGAMREILSK